MTDNEYETLWRLLDGEPENDPGGNIVKQVEAMVGRLRDENERLRGNAPMVDYDALEDTQDTVAVVCGLRSEVARLRELLRGGAELYCGGEGYAGRLEAWAEFVSLLLSDVDERNCDAENAKIAKAHKVFANMALPLSISRSGKIEVTR